MSAPRFDASLPTPRSTKWTTAPETFRAARQRDPEAHSPGEASYAPPGGEAVPFILGGVRFSGGQSTDTAEYPFGGLWSNERLNEKPQSLSVDGFLRGEKYAVRRNAMIEALRVPTDDDEPGFLDLPFWGRFPVVVGKGYEVSESSDEQGQCRVSIPFTRAGIGRAERAAEGAGADVGSAAEGLRAAAIDGFGDELTPQTLDVSALRAGLGRVTHALLSVVGRIQGPTTALNALTASVLGILDLVDQGVRAPRRISTAAFNAVAAIVGGIAAIGNGAAAIGTGPSDPFALGDGAPPESAPSRAGGPTLPLPDNERNSLLLFLSADSFSALPGEAATVGQKATARAVENLYRTAAYLASVEIVAGMDSPTRGEAAGYWRLLARLEESVDRENPAVHAALSDARAALSARLSAQGLSAEKAREVPSPAPLLYLALRLGCDEAELRRLNRVADSFVVEGEVVYV